MKLGQYIELKYDEKNKQKAYLEVKGPHVTLGTYKNLQRDLEKATQFLRFFTSHARIKLSDYDFDILIEKEHTKLFPEYGE